MPTESPDPLNVFARPGRRAAGASLASAAQVVSCSTQPERILSSARRCRGRGGPPGWGGGVLIPRVAFSRTVQRSRLKTSVSSDFNCGFQVQAWRSQQSTERPPGQPRRGWRCEFRLAGSGGQGPRRVLLRRVVVWHGRDFIRRGGLPGFWQRGTFFGAGLPRHGGPFGGWPKLPRSLGAEWACRIGVGTRGGLVVTGGLDHAIGCLLAWPGYIRAGNTPPRCRCR